MDSMQQESERMMRGDAELREAREKHLRERADWDAAFQKGREDMRIADERAKLEEQEESREITAKVQEATASSQDVSDEVRRIQSRVHNKLQILQSESSTQEIRGLRSKSSADPNVLGTGALVRHVCYTSPPRSAEGGSASARGDTAGTADCSQDGPSLGPAPTSPQREAGSPTRMAGAVQREGDGDASRGCSWRTMAEEQKRRMRALQARLAQQSEEWRTAEQAREALRQELESRRGEHAQIRADAQAQLAMRAAYSTLAIPASPETADLLRRAQLMMAFLNGSQGFEGSTTEELEQLQETLRNRQRGADQAKIELCCKVSQYEECDDGDGVCPICLANFVVGDMVRELPCSHLYHQDCVDRWLQIQKRCPMCKRDITEM